MRWARSMRSADASRGPSAERSLFFLLDSGQRPIPTRPFGLAQYGLRAFGREEEFLFGSALRAHAPSSLAILASQGARPARIHG
jgi:hypothetical protein